MIIKMDVFNENLMNTWLVSSSLPPSVLRTILGIFGRSSDVYHAFRTRYSRISCLIPEKNRMLLLSHSDENYLKSMEDKLTQYQIRSVTLSDAAYPENLKNIPDPPAVLFYRGNLSSLSGRVLSLIGSRNASYSGLRASKMIARDLSDHGVTVISGLASGIDQAAHEGCLEGNSPTVAVLGCGLDIVYPQSNSKLSEEILSRHGAMISEYIPGEKPLGFHFPVRNRIISGLSRAVVLVEAKIRSGSMTTIRHALDQGREVFVYPGEAGSPYYEGNHTLLREGARFFTKAEEILQDMDWLDNPPIVRQNIDCSTPSDALLNNDERKVIDALKPGKLTLDQISDRTGLDVSELLGTVTLLQIKGFLILLPGKFYQLVR